MLKLMADIENGTNLFGKFDLTAPAKTTKFCFVDAMHDGVKVNHIRRKSRIFRNKTDELLALLDQIFCLFTSIFVPFDI